MKPIERRELYYAAIAGQDVQVPEPITREEFFLKAILDSGAGGSGVRFEVVNALPATGEDGVIYLVPNSGETPNIYDEYIWVNESFEKIGTTEIDLSGYVTFEEV